MIDKNVLDSLREDMSKQNPAELKKALIDISQKFENAKRVDLLYGIVVLGAKIASLNEVISELNAEILELKGGSK